MRAAPLAVLVLVVTACAAPEAESPLQPTPSGTVSVTPEGRVGTTIRREDAVGVTAIPGTREAAWPHLKAAWTDVGLPEPVADDRLHTLTLANRVVTRRLGRTNLSSYLSCGRSMNGWNADTHRIHLTVRSLLETREGTTRLHTRVDAVAQSTEGASATRLECTSTGALEGLIAKRLQERIADGG